MNTSAPTIRQALVEHWKGEAKLAGPLSASCSLLLKSWQFARDSTPWRLRQRYGDTDYDWDYRVNTTSAAVGWRDRLLGMLHSPYQPTDPALFHEAIEDMKKRTNLDFGQFTFLDLGSGKGRVLMMAADYPFQRIIGVELLPSLHQIAQENLRRYKTDSQKCLLIESLCADAVNFPLPTSPLLIYLFNPFPEAGLRRFLVNLVRSVRQNPRAVYVLYHNPVFEHVLRESGSAHKVAATPSYSMFAMFP